MIGLACKVVGALLVVSLVALPVATALIISRSYLQTCVLSVVLGIVYTMVGLIFSYFEDVRPGGSIVVCAVLGIIIFLAISSVNNRIKHKPQSAPAIN